MKPQRLTLESEALEEFRQSLNAAIEIVTCQLVRRNRTKWISQSKKRKTDHLCIPRHGGGERTGSGRDPFHDPVNRRRSDRAAQEINKLKKEERKWIAQVLLP